MSDIEGNEYIHREQIIIPAQVERLAVVDEPLVTPVSPVQTVVAPVGTVRTAYSRRFAPDAIIATVVGLFLLIVGLLAVVRAGFDGPMDTPVVEVLGFTHTTTLGLIEAFFGLCLLLCGTSRARSGALFFGWVLGIAAFVGAIQSESFEESLALESALAWLMVIGAVAVVVSALMMPRYVMRTTKVQRLP